MPIDFDQLQNMSIGTGDPNGSVTDDKGAIRLRTDGGQGTSHYFKVSDSVADEGWYNWKMDTDFNTLTYGATVDWEVRNSDASGRPNAILTLTGDATLNAPTGMQNDERMVLIIVQDATGGRTLSFPSAFQFIGNPDHIETPSGYDILYIYYENASGNFYCHYGRPPLEKVEPISPGASDVDLDMSALTNQQIREYHGRKIFFNNLNSTGGGSNSKLPFLSDVWLGFYMDVEMRQSANGGAINFDAAQVADLIYITGIDTSPFLDTSGTHTIGLDDDEIHHLSFRITAYDPTGTGALKYWGVTNMKWRYVGGVRSLTAGATVTWDLLKGSVKTLVPDQATTLAISNYSDEDPSHQSGALHINMGGTAYDINLPANSKIADGNDYLTAGSPPTVENMVANEDYVLTYVYDGTDYVWNMAKYV